MKKVSIAVHDIILNNPAIHFGFHHRFVNLSQLSRFIRPLVEARTRKAVKESAILMSISRLQSRLTPPADFNDIILDEISVRSGLCSFTVQKTAQIRQQLRQVFAQIRDQDDFITLTEGNTEITAILEDRRFEAATGPLSVPLAHVYRNISSVGIRLSREAQINPGTIYRLVQQIAMQHISIIEIASTASELSIYVREADLQMAFDSIYRRFSKRTGGSSDI